MFLAAVMAGTMVAAVPVMAEEATEAATEAAAAATDVSDLSDKKVGVCIYQFSDNFMTLFRTELKNLVGLGFSKDNITIVDGVNDQATQYKNKHDSFIADKVDVLIINPVNSSSAATITDKVVDAGIPLVYINREPDADEEARWEENNWNVTYVGCVTRVSPVHSRAS